MIDRGQLSAALASRPLVFGDVEFRVAPMGGYVNSEHLVIVKSMESVESLLELWSSLQSPNVVELGVAYGGSVGLLALAARPNRMVAVDLSPHRMALLDEVLERNGLADAVSVHYGVDQADRDTLSRLVDGTFGAEELDLVIDDASHLYAPSVASFEVLFPRLRAGGRYLIEDWCCDHHILAMIDAGQADESSPFHAWSNSAIAGELVSGNDGEQPQTEVAVGALGRRENPDADAQTSLSHMALELSLGVPVAGNGIRSVSVGPYWIEVIRDDADLSGGFSLGEACPDPFGSLRR